MPMIGQNKLKTVNELAPVEETCAWGHWQHPTFSSAACGEVVDHCETQHHVALAHIVTLSSDHESTAGSVGSASSTTSSAACGKPLMMPARRGKTFSTCTCWQRAALCRECRQRGSDHHLRCMRKVVDACCNIHVATLIIYDYAVTNAEAHACTCQTLDDISWVRQSCGRPACWNSPSDAAQGNARAGSAADSWI